MTTVGDDAIVLAILSDVDIVAARQRGRALAGELGFSTTDATLIATAISEVARNIVTYAGKGEIVFRVLVDGARTGIEIVARDEGPGIADIDRATRDGYSSGQGMGLGLPGCRRLMDEFRIEAAVGVGTTVTMRRWVGRHAG